jgi:hypothetical protein
VIVLLLLLWFGEVHNLHLSYSRVAVDAHEIFYRISFFPDDFELMLSNYYDREINGLRHVGDADSLLLPVLKKHLLVEINGKAAIATIEKSGLEADMCWYMLRYKSDANIERVAIDNRLLFAVFEDQKNLLNVLDVRSGKKSSFYGVRDASRFDVAM